MKAVVDIGPQITFYCGFAVAVEYWSQGLVHHADSCAVVANNARLTVLER